MVESAYFTQKCILECALFAKICIFYCAIQFLNSVNTLYTFIPFIVKFIYTFQYVLNAKV